MRNLIASNYMTLDGYFAGPNGELDWFVWDRETELFAIEIIKTIDTILFGRKTYQMMADYWPTAEPSTDDPIIIEAMNNLPKVVFSRTLDTVPWNNSRLVKDGIADEVARLKDQPGQDLVIYGSGTIVSELTQAGLIDKYYIYVNPVILGQGKPLFQDLTHRLNLNLSGTKTFKNGVVLLDYHR